MKQLIFYSLFLINIFISCNQKKNKKQVNNGKELVENCILNQGGELFNSSTITFNTSNTNYEMTNYDHKVKYKMQKIFNNDIHFATYDRGLVKYFINDTLRDELSYNNLVVNARLEKFLHTISIPFNMTFNGTKYQRLEDVIIRSKKYFSILITFTKVEGLHQDKFILYINKEINQIEYLALDYEILGNSLSFRRLINPRRIDGVLFNDFIAFTSKTNASLENLYKEYNNASLNGVNPVLLKDIKVFPLTEDPFKN